SRCVLWDAASNAALSLGQQSARRRRRNTSHAPSSTKLTRQIAARRTLRRATGEFALRDSAAPVTQSACGCSPRPGVTATSGLFVGGGRFRFFVENVFNGDRGLVAEMA